MSPYNCILKRKIATKLSLNYCLYAHPFECVHVFFISQRNKTIRIEELAAYYIIESKIRRIKKLLKIHSSTKLRINFTKSSTKALFLIYWGDFWFFKHLKVIENRRLDLVRPCLDRLFMRLRFRWLNWNSLIGDQG